MVGSAAWPGVLDPGLLKPEAAARGQRLSDAAKAGRWPEVFEVLDLAWVDVNQSRLGGSSWFAPLHQAAWHGAPASVASDLLARGALRSLPARDGRTPYDVASERGHAHLLDLLTPPQTSLTPERAADLDRGLASLIDGRLTPPGGIAESYAKPLRDSLRYPPVAVLPEVEGQRVWFAVPGMYGGFSVALMKGDYLYVESWIRVVGGSGQAHVVTHEGVTLVEEGFV
jgi:hypothetical protein